MFILRPGGILSCVLLPNYRLYSDTWQQAHIVRRCSFANAGFEETRRLRRQCRCAPCMAIVRQKRSDIRGTDSDHMRQVRCARSCNPNRPEIGSSPLRALPDFAGANGQGGHLPQFAHSTLFVQGAPSLVPLRKSAAPRFGTVRCTRGSVPVSDTHGARPTDLRRRHGRDGSLRQPPSSLVTTEATVAGGLGHGDKPVFYDCSRNIHTNAISKTALFGTSGTCNPATRRPARRGRPGLCRRVWSIFRKRRPAHRGDCLVAIPDGNVTIYVSEGTDSLLFVFVDEDSEQDAVHRGAVLESAQCSSPDLAEPALDSVGGSDLPALIGVLVAETGQQIVEIVAQACDGPGVCIFPTVGEAPGGAPGLSVVGAAAWRSCLTASCCEPCRGHS